MNALKIYEKKFGRRFLMTAALIFLLAWVAGCSGNYGRLNVNPEVKKQFENYQVSDDYRYYFSGSSVNPRVVIGIHKDYQLITNLWQPVDLSPHQLKFWVDPFSLNANIDHSNGSDILTPDGKKIGVWYSFRDWRDWALVEIVGTDKVRIGMPIGPKDDWDDVVERPRRPRED